MIHMDIQTSYKTLGVFPGSTVQEIRDAYKEQVKTFHPDLFENKGNEQIKAQAKLIQANLAYETIRSHLDNQLKSEAVPFKPEQYYQKHPHGAPPGNGNRKSKSTYMPAATTLHDYMQKRISNIDRAYNLAKIKANERITTKIQHLTEAETEAKEYLNHIDKKYFKNGYFEIHENKKVGIAKLKKLFSSINNKIG